MRPTMSTATNLGLTKASNLSERAVNRVRPQPPPLPVPRLLRHQSITVLPYLPQHITPPPRLARHHILQRLLPRLMITADLRLHTIDRQPPHHPRPTHHLHHPPSHIPQHPRHHPAHPATAITSIPPRHHPAHPAITSILPRHRPAHPATAITSIPPRSLPLRHP